MYQFPLRMLTFLVVAASLTSAALGTLPGAAETERERGDVLVADATSASSPSVDCAGWNSDDEKLLEVFYKALTPEAVVACLQAGADPDVRDKTWGGTPLHIAASWNGNPAVLAALLDAGADLDARDKWEWTPLHWAAAWNDNPAVPAALLDAGADPNARNENGRTPLHIAAKWNGNSAVLAALLAAGADPTLKDNDRTTPLELAIKERRPAEIIATLREMLVAETASTPSPSVDCAGWKADDEELQWSFYKNLTPEVVLACLEAGADLYARDVNYDGTPLHWAAVASDNPAVLAVLLESGVDPNARNKGGATPLHWAVGTKNDNRAVLEALLDAGADPTLRNTDGDTPLELAIKRKRPAEIIAVLHEVSVAEAASSPSPSVDCSGWKADDEELQWSFYRNLTPEVVLACLEAGADLFARDVNYDGTPLHWAAAASGNPAVLAALLHAGADPHARNKFGNTPLHFAASNENPSVLAVLLDARVDPNARNNGGATPLHWAAGTENDNRTVLEALLDAGADPTLRNTDGDTPLELAIKRKRPAEIIAALREASVAGATSAPSPSVDCAGWKADDEGLQGSFYRNLTPEVVRACLDAGVELQARDDKYDGTPLHWAAAWTGSPAVLAALLDAGADPHARNKFGNTPLHFAASNDNPAVLAVLLDTGVDPNARNNGGETPLHWATWNENPAVPTALLDAGADPTLRNTDGDTPLELAIKNERPADILGVLREVSVADAASTPPSTVDCAGWTEDDVELRRNFYSNLTPEIVLACLKAGSDPNVRDRNGWTPLHFVAEDSENAAVLAALLDAGADPNARDKWDLTPLHHAVSNDNPAVLAELLAGGADPGLTGDTGDTPLDIAVRAERPNEIIAALEARAQRLSCGHWTDVEGAEGFFETAIAADLARCLAAGADPNARDSRNRTPLHFAVEQSENSAVLAELMDSGADPTLKDNEGTTPLELANKEGRPAETIAALEARAQRLSCGHWTGLEGAESFFKHATAADVSRCLAAGADPNAHAAYDRTPLHFAAKWNENSVVIAALLDAGADPSAPDADDWTPLHIAALSNKKLAVTTALLDAGANPNVHDQYGWTPLHVAAHFGENPAVLSALLDGGADPAQTDDYGDTPLDVAIREERPAEIIGVLEADAQHLSCGDWTDRGNADDFFQNATAADVSRCVAAGIDPNARDEDDRTPLHIAVAASWKNENPAVLAALLGVGADPNARDESGMTPLHSAAHNDISAVLAAALLDGGADPNARDRYDGTPLHNAVWNETSAVLSVLLGAGADPTLRDVGGDTPLDVAIKWERPAEIIAALEAGGKRLSCGHWTDWESAKGFFESATAADVSRCLGVGADPNARPIYELTPLHLTVMYSDNSAPVAALLDAGADPTVRNAFGYTPLELAIKEERPAEIIAALEVGAHRLSCGHWTNLEGTEGFFKFATAADVSRCLTAGADPNARGRFNRTPLHLAVIHNDNPAVLAALLDAGADLDARDHWNWTPLQFAAVKGENSVAVAALLDAGAAPNVRDQDGWTPLHNAASWHDNPTVAAALLDGGADPNSRDQLGRTPLHLAASWNDKPAVLAELLDAGADPTLKDNDGDTPLDVAVRAERPAEIIATLREASLADVASASSPSVDCEGWTSSDEELLRRFYTNLTPEVALACLEAGADLYARGTYYRTPLHFAAEDSANPAALATLLDAGADLNARDEFGWMPLHSAAANENPAVLAALLDAGADLNALDGSGRTVLHIAAIANDNPAVLAALLEAGANPNANDASGNTPLHWAAVWNGNPTMIETLLASGADPTLINLTGITPLELAIKEERPAEIIAVLREVIVADAASHTSRSVDCEGWITDDWKLRWKFYSNLTPEDVLTCLDAGADPNARDSNGRTPLQWAAGNSDNPAVLAALLDAGADPNARDKRGWTPLHWATRNNENPAVLAALLDAGADATLKNDDGDTPLESATKNESPAEIIALLREVTGADAASAPLPSVDCAGWSTDDVDARVSFYWNLTPEVVLACLQDGADLHAGDYNNETPLHGAAAWNDNPAVLAALLAAGADLHARDRWGKTPLHQAARWNDNLAVISALLDDGADPTLTDHNGNTPAELAIKEGKPAKIIAALEAVAWDISCRNWADFDGAREFLKNATAEDVSRCLSAGADPNLRDEYDLTLLHIEAQSNDNPAVLWALLAGGADLHARDKWGKTPLHWAAATNGLPAVVAALLDAGADLHARDDRGMTPLHAAAQQTISPAVLAVLLDAGGDLHLGDKWGSTAVHYAAWNENPAALAALLDAGADPNARSVSELTPLHNAVRNENPAVLEALLGAGADPNARDKGDRTPLHWAVWYSDNPAVPAALLDAGANPIAAGTNNSELITTLLGTTAEWLEQMKMRLRAPPRAEEDGEATITLHFPDAQVWDRGDIIALGDFAVEVTAEDDREYQFVATLPNMVEYNWKSGRPLSQITVDDSTLSGVWRSDLEGATVLDAALSNLRTLNNEDKSEPLRLESLEMSSDVEQGSDKLWEGEFTIELSDLGFTLDRVELGLGVSRLDVAVEDAGFAPFMALYRTVLATEDVSELEPLQEMLALMAEGGVGRLEAKIALRDLVAMDRDEVMLELDELDWLLVAEERDELSDLAITIEAAETQLLSEELPAELLPDEATVDMTVKRYPLRRTAGEFHELVPEFGRRSVERVLQRDVMSAMAEAGTSLEIRELRIEGPNIGIEAEGLIQVDAESPLGASGRVDARIRGFRQAIEWATEHAETDLVNFLVYLKGLGEPLDDEDDELPTYAYELMAARDGSITVNNVPLQELVESLQ